MVKIYWFTFYRSKFVKFCVLGQIFLVVWKKTCLNDNKCLVDYQVSTKLVPTSLVDVVDITLNDK